MSGSITVTPGTTFANDTAVTHTSLNAAGAPTMSVGAGQIGKRELHIPSVAGAMDPLRAWNAFRNPMLCRDSWEVISSAKSCPADEWTTNAASWVAMPAGAAITYGEAAYSVTIAGVKRGAQLTGATSVTTVQFGQYIGPDYARALARAGTITVSFAFENQTGATVTPGLSVQTGPSPGSGKSLTEVATDSFSAVLDGEGGRIECSLDLTGLANIENGFRLAVTFASGELDAGSKSVILGAFQLEPAAAASTWIVPETPVSRTPGILNEWQATADPGLTDDEAAGYSVGSKWRNATDSRIFVCSRARAGQARWMLLGGNVPLYFLCLDEETEGSDGGNAASGPAVDPSWNTVIFTDSRAFTLSGVDVARKVTPAIVGTFKIFVSHVIYRTGVGKASITQTGMTYTDGLCAFSRSAADVSTVLAEGDFWFKTSALTEFRPTFMIQTTRNTDGFGKACSFGAKELYGFWEMEYLPERLPLLGTAGFLTTDAYCVVTEPFDLSNQINSAFFATSSYILLTNQDDPAENGIYDIVPGLLLDRVSGAAATDYNNVKVMVIHGIGNLATGQLDSSQANTIWFQTETLATFSDDQFWTQAAGYSVDQLDE